MAPLILGLPLQPKVVFASYVVRMSAASGSESALIWRRIGHPPARRVDAVDRMIGDAGRRVAPHLGCGVCGFFVGVTRTLLTSAFLSDSSFANRSAFNRAVFSLTARPSASYAGTAFWLSRA